jgi:hypothetical protein
MDCCRHSQDRGRRDRGRAGRRWHRLVARRRGGQAATGSARQPRARKCARSRRRAGRRPRSAAWLRDACHRSGACLADRTCAGFGDCRTGACGGTDAVGIPVQHCAATGGCHGKNRPERAPACAGGAIRRRPRRTGEPQARRPADGPAAKSTQPRRRIGAGWRNECGRATAPGVGSARPANAGPLHGHGRSAGSMRAGGDANPDLIAARAHGRAYRGHRVTRAAARRTARSALRAEPRGARALRTLKPRYSRRGDLPCFTFRARCAPWPLRCSSR